MAVGSGFIFKEVAFEFDVHGRENQGESVAQVTMFYTLEA
jgi:hypothetical protein